MSILKKILIPIAVVAILLATYLVIKGVQKNKDDIDSDIVETTKPRLERLIDFGSLDANKIVVNNAEGEYIFARAVDEDWEIISHPEIDLNPSRVNSIAINLSSILPDKLIEEDATDLSVYGLDKPIKVEVSTRDGKKYILEIGSQTPTGGAYYIKVPESNNIYTLGSYTTERLFITRNDLKVKTLFSFNEGEDPFNLATEISVIKNGEQFFIASKEDEQWYLSYPIINIADLTGLAPIIQSITASIVDEFIEENPKDLSIYGLDIPKFTFDMKVDDKKIVLHMGNDKDPGKTKYVMLEGRDEVFTIDISQFNFLDKPLKEFIEVFAYIVNIDTVTKIVLEIDGATHEMGIKTNEEDNDLDEFTFNGNDATMVDEKDNQPFRKLYQAVIGVTRSALEPEAKPTGNAEIRFTYTLNKDPWEMVIEFVPKDDWSYYLFRNGDYTGILVEKIKFDDEEGVRNMIIKMEEAIGKE